MSKSKTELYDAYLLIPLKQKHLNLTHEKASQILKYVCKHQIVGHYLQFDLSILYRIYGALPRVARDTNILAKMRNEKEQSLEALATKYLGVGKSGDFMEVFKPEKAEDGTLIYEIDLENQEHLDYLTRDAVAPCDLEKHLGQFDTYNDVFIYKLESQVLPLTLLR